MNKESRITITLDEHDILMANEIAEFVRDNMFELNKHPMDYQDHYEYILKVYQNWCKQRLEDL